MYLKIIYEDRGERLYSTDNLEWDHRNSTLTIMQFGEEIAIPLPHDAIAYALSVTGEVLGRYVTVTPAPGQTP